MQINSFILRQFRSYKNYSGDLSKGVNIVVGPNASGKTNLLEAVYFASVGKSFRVKDKDLIEFGKKQAKIELIGLDTSREIRLKDTQVGLEKSFNINNQKYKRLPQKHHIPTTIFEPNHLKMIDGSPSLRRDYLDSILLIIKPGYKNTLRQYERALAQRNKLLKNPTKTIKDQIFVWDLKLSEFGAVIYDQRRNLVEQINTSASHIYQKLSSSKQKIKLSYSSTINSNDYTSALVRVLNKSLEEDRQKGFTSTGVHRDDLEFEIDSNSAKLSASRGEMRTLVLMGKVVEIQLINQQLGIKPLLLLDDVFSELDTTRRQALTKYLSDHQTIITTTDADSIVKHFLGDYNIIPTKVG